MTETDWTPYEALVGRRWPAYRKPFQRFAKGGWISWNWAALFGTLAWLCYRRLTLWSWLYVPFSTPALLIALALSMGTTDACEIALNPSSGLIIPVLLSLLALSWIVPPLIANRLYYQRVRTLVRKAATPNGPGSVLGAHFLSLLLLAIAVTGTPMMGTYRLRSIVGETLNLAKPARLALQLHLEEHGSLPDSIDALQVPTSSEYIQRLELSADGTLRAVFGGGEPILTGYSLKLTPKLSENRIAEWSCASPDLPNQCLPSQCRQPNGR